MNERTFHSSQAHRLEDPERLKWLPLDEVIGQIPLKPGSVVADVGAGTGYLTIPLARAVGEIGRVIAVDLQKEMLTRIREKLAAPGNPSNVDLVEGDAARTTLPPQSCDIVVMVNIWHELDDYPAVLVEAARILRPEGALVIVDWRADLPSPPGPPAEHRVAALQVQTTLEQSSWSIHRSGTIGLYSHLIVASQRAKSPA
jgi:ubiquinone/menaquinone biosynthesis C-methylase UbiE